jgi:hypothetical protein
MVVFSQKPAKFVGPVSRALNEAGGILGDGSNTPGFFSAAGTAGGVAIGNDEAGTGRFDEDFTACRKLSLVKGCVAPILPGLGVPSAG